MSKDEVNRLIVDIKSLYPTFSINEEVVMMWINKLSRYRKEDVNKALDDYFRSGERDCPTLGELLYGLDEVGSETKLTGYFPCGKCGRIYESLEEQDRCEERCNSINYIMSMCYRFEINIRDFYTKNLRDLTLEEVNEKYNDFIKRVIEEDKVQNKLKKDEKQSLENYYKNVIMKMEDLK